MQAKSISVVIPTYKGKHLLEMNLPSVYEALHTCNAPFEIIIVDDGSADDTQTFINQQYPDIKLLINNSNKGFSHTINRGIFEAKNELVFALNNDVKLKANYFNELFKYFEQPDTFGVMGKIVGITDEKTQDAAKYPVVKASGIKGSYNYETVEKTTTRWLPSFFISGANALMNREKLLLLGGFNEIFSPFYFEDTDLGLRAWRVGWQCYYEPLSVCLHEVSSTIGQLKSNDVRVIIERNKLIFNHLHLNRLPLLYFRMIYYLKCFFKLLKGDNVMLKAIQMFRQLNDELNTSKQKLQKVQTTTNIALSSKQAERKILSVLNQIKIKVF